MSEELLRIVEPDLDSITHETLHMIIALDDFGLRPSLEMSQLICRRLIRAERERDEARAQLTAAINKPLTTAMKVAISSIHEAEAAGYRRGVEDAAKKVGTALENPIEQRCCGFGMGSPPECCATPISLIEGERAHEAILALLEQTGDEKGK